MTFFVLHQEVKVIKMAYFGGESRHRVFFKRKSEQRYDLLAHCPALVKDIQLKRSHIQLRYQTLELPLFHHLGYERFYELSDKRIGIAISVDLDNNIFAEKVK